MVIQYFDLIVHATTKSQIWWKWGHSTSKVTFLGPMDDQGKYLYPLSCVDECVYTPETKTILAVLFTRVSVLQQLKRFDQLMPRLQLCFSSSSLQHMLKRLLGLFGLNWKRIWTLPLLSASRCYDPQCFSIFFIFAFVSMYMCCELTWENLSSRHQKRSRGLR